MQTKDLEDQKRPGQDLEIIKWNNTTHARPYFYEDNEDYSCLDEPQKELFI